MGEVHDPDMETKKSKKRKMSHQQIEPECNQLLKGAQKTRLKGKHKKKAH
jgi:hypothetical protein